MISDTTGKKGCWAAGVSAGMNRLYLSGTSHVLDILSAVEVHHSAYWCSYFRNNFIKFLLEWSHPPVFYRHVLGKANCHFFLNVASCAYRTRPACG